MAAKRDILTEIEKRRERLFFRIPRLDQARRRLSALMRAADYLRSRTKGAVSPTITRELHRHFPVALVAVSEGYFRMLYQELIDSGEPYRSNARQFGDVRLDVHTFLGSHSGLASAGEIIAHQLPHNNPGQMEANLSILLGEDFSATFRARLAEEDLQLGGGTLFQKQLLELIHRTFALRHTYCHELATRFPVSPRMSGTFIKAFIMWIHMVDEHVRDHQKSQAGAGIRRKR